MATWVRSRWQFVAIARASSVSACANLRNRCAIVTSNMHDCAKWFKSNVTKTYRCCRCFCWKPNKRTASLSITRKKKRVLTSSSSTHPTTPALPTPPSSQGYDSLPTYVAPTLFDVLHRFVTGSRYICCLSSFS